MKKKLYKNEEEINRLCVLKKLIKLEKQAYQSIYLLSGHPYYRYQYINIKNIFPEKFCIEYLSLQNSPKNISYLRLEIITQ